MFVMQCFWFLPTAELWRVDYKRLDYEALATLLLQQQQKKRGVEAADGPQPSGVYAQVPQAPVAPNAALAQPDSAQYVPPAQQ